MISIKVISTYIFDTSNSEWRATVSPRLIQSFPDYFYCQKCENTLHRSEVFLAEKTKFRCPKCGEILENKVDDTRQMEPMNFCAGSICEVNSAIETNLLILQREAEQAESDYEQAEQKAAEDRENTPAIDEDNG